MCVVFRVILARFGLARLFSPGRFHLPRVAFRASTAWAGYWGSVPISQQESWTSWMFGGSPARSSSRIVIGPSAGILTQPERCSWLFNETATRGTELRKDRIRPSSSSRERNFSRIEFGSFLTILQIFLLFQHIWLEFEVATAKYLIWTAKYLIRKFSFLFLPV